MPFPLRQNERSLLRGTRHVLTGCVMLLSCAASLGCSKKAENSGSQVYLPDTAAGGAPALGSGGTTVQPSLAGARSEPGSGGLGGATSSGAAGGGRGTAGQTGSAATSGAGGANTTPAAAGAGGATAAGAGGASGAAGAPASCEKGKVKAAEVVFIGESFIAQTGAIPRLTSDLARAAGTIGMNESYRSSAVSGTQLTTNEIPMQYASAKAAGPIKVILMDGGGNDLLFSSRCASGFDSTCKEIVTVVDTLFKQMGPDGVKDVVYFFYPDPMGIGASIKDAMDILRPEMKKLCDETTDVRCVWVDQRESWNGHYDTYTSDGIHPTEEGATASAKQIWEAMVANCIAQ